MSFLDLDFLWISGSLWVIGGDSGFWVIGFVVVFMAVDFLGHLFNSVLFPLISSNFLFIFSFSFALSICFFFEWLNLTLDGSSFSHLFLDAIG